MSLGVVARDPELLYEVYHRDWVFAREIRSRHVEIQPLTVLVFLLCILAFVRRLSIVQSVGTIVYGLYEDMMGGHNELQTILLLLSLRPLVCAASVGGVKLNILQVRNIRRVWLSPSLAFGIAIRLVAV